MPKPSSDLWLCEFSIGLGCRITLKLCLNGSLHCHSGRACHQTHVVPFVLLSTHFKYILWNCIKQNCSDDSKHKAVISVFFPWRDPKLDAHFRLKHRFTIAESFWSCRKWCKIHYSLEKGRTFPSESYSSPCYLLASTTEARRSI